MNLSDGLFLPKLVCRGLMQENCQKVNSLDNLYFFNIFGQTFIDG